MVKKEIEVSLKDMVNFGVLPTEYFKLLENNTLKPLDFALLTLLWSSGKEYFAVQSVVSKRLGVSDRHGRRSFKALEELGLIKQRNAQGMYKDYILVVPSSCVKNKKKLNTHTKDFNGYVMEFISFEYDNSKTINEEEVNYLDR